MSTQINYSHATEQDQVLIGSQHTSPPGMVHGYLCTVTLFQKLSGDADTEERLALDYSYIVLLGWLWQAAFQAINRDGGVWSGITLTKIPGDHS